MNFFERQANARRQTGRLLLYFTLSVTLTVLAVDVGLFYLGLFSTGGMQGNWFWHEWSAQAFVGTFLVIGGGSLIEYLHLRDGGRAVAEMVGARRVDYSTRDLKERQFINVVEEMSIASGVPTPKLYVMDRESGINAFVAGLELHDTVMVMTQGALDTFTRDELQAVAGHEFSHILNGDMRLNMRLIALLAGILTLGQIGSFIMRTLGGSRGSSRKDDRGGVPHLFLVGLMLWLIGSIGLFFGRLIKAAISRQREFLADASSVQFTRNPDGLAGALIKIKHNAERSWLDNIRSESMSHMCFGETLNYSALLATHPPLDERIKALGKQYLIKDRAYERELRQQETAAQRVEVQESSAVQNVQEAPRNLPPIPFVKPELGGGAAEAVVGLAVAMSVPALLEQAGTVDPSQLASAQELHRRLPPLVQRALQTSSGTQALLYALIATQNTATSTQKQQFLEQRDPNLLKPTQDILRSLEGLDFSFALPLTELAIPRLQVLPENTQREFVARLQAFALMDGQLSTYEFALLMLLRKQLHGVPPSKPTRLDQALHIIAQLVVRLLRVGGMNGVDLERSYYRLMRTISPAIPPMPEARDNRFRELVTGLPVLAGLPLMERRQVLELAATAVLADGKVKREEYELLRVVAALLDCPMPMLQL